MRTDQWPRWRLAQKAGKEATGVLNLIKPRANLEIQENFFSIRIVDNWYVTLEKIKMARNPRRFNLGESEETWRRTRLDVLPHEASNGLKHRPRWPARTLLQVNSSK